MSKDDDMLSNKADFCPLCGANYILVGRAHHCKGYNDCELTAGRSPSGEVNAVNEPQKGEESVNKPVNTEQLTERPSRADRGKYPNTDKRRQYMLKYMRNRRKKGE